MVFSERNRHDVALCAPPQTYVTPTYPPTTTMSEDRRCRATPHDVRGALVYLELPPSESSVHERDCKWPRDVEGDVDNASRAVRRDTHHVVADARTYPNLSLRTVGFQLFGRGDDVPMAG